MTSAALKPLIANALANAERKAQGNAQDRVKSNAQGKVWVQASAEGVSSKDTSEKVASLEVPLLASMGANLGLIASTTTTTKDPSTKEGR